MARTSNAKGPKGQYREPANTVGPKKKERPKKSYSKINTNAASREKVESFIKEYAKKAKEGRTKEAIKKRGEK